MIFFRVDSSYKIGTGHVMRCLSLAEEFKRRGQTVTFICRDLDGHVSDKISQRGFGLSLLPEPKGNEALGESEYAPWLGVTQNQDARETIDILENYSQKEEREKVQAKLILIVDHYALDKDWESHIYDSVYKLAVIDDLANRLHVSDVLIDHNQYIDFLGRYDDLVPAHTQKLLGSSYVLLNSVYTQARKAAAVRHSVSTILVFFGGFDAQSMVYKTINAIFPFLPPEMKVTLVLGSNNPKREAIYERYGNSSNIEIKDYVSNLHEYMVRSDLAISAAGGATWERCALGLPSIIVSVAENQTLIAKSAAYYKIAEYCGDFQDVDMNELVSSCISFIEDSDKLSVMSENCFKFINTDGISKVVEELMHEN